MSISNLSTFSDGLHKRQVGPDQLSGRALLGAMTFDLAVPLVTMDEPIDQFERRR